MMQNKPPIGGGKGAEHGAVKGLEVPETFVLHQQHNLLSRARIPAACVGLASGLGPAEHARESLAWEGPWSCF